MPYGPHDANRARLESLKSSGLLNGQHGIDFDRVTDLASRAANVPVSLVSLVDEERQIFAGACGLPEELASARQTPLSHSFCKHVVHRRSPLVIPDARKHELVSGNPAIADFGVVAYLGFPVLGAGRHVYGSLCAIDTRPRDWRDDDIEIMRGFASIVSSLIEQHLGGLYQKLLSDVILHDLKMPLQRIGIAAELFGEMAGGLPEPLQTAARSLRVNADQAGALVASLLHSGRPAEKCDDLQVAAQAAAVRMRPLADARGMEIHIEDSGSSLALDVTERTVAQVLDHLIANSLRFSGRGGIRLRLKRVGAAAILDVEDDGPGFQAEDYPKLFQRYAPLSAKPVDGEACAGLGLHIVRNLLESEGATIVLLSQPGESAAFRITAPLRRLA